MSREEGREGRKEGGKEGVENRKAPSTDRWEGKREGGRARGRKGLGLTSKGHRGTPLPPNGIREEVEAAHLDEDGRVIHLKEGGEKGKREWERGREGEREGGREGLTQETRMFCP